MLYESIPIDDSVKHGRPISVAISMRWLPYKPTSEQFKKGIKGRWQIAGDFGWENVIGGGPTEFLQPVER